MRFGQFLAGLLATAVCAVANAQDTAERKSATPQVPLPTTGCAIKRVIEPNTTEYGPGLRVVRHGGDPLTLVDTDATSLSCVDARTDHSMIGAFAGDIGEFLTGLDTYRQLCTKNETVEESVVLKLLQGFVKAHTTRERPFYMHTDNASLSALLTKMGADSFPLTEPDPVTKQQWFDTMLQGQTRYHGCGHLWYQIAFPAEYDADVNLIYGLLKAFFELYWDPEYAERMRYELVLGTMDARAVVAVEMKTTNLRGSEQPTKCADQAVPLRPRFCPKGCPATNVREFKRSANYSTGPEYDVFTFHATAVERHRKKVLVPYFLNKCKKPRVTFNKFYKQLTETAEKWAEASLHHLNATPDKKPHLPLVIEVEAV